MGRGKDWLHGFEMWLLTRSGQVKWLDKMGNKSGKKAGTDKTILDVQK